MSSPDQPNPTTTQFLTYLLATLSSLSHHQTHSHTQSQSQPASSSLHHLYPAATYPSENETAQAPLPDAAKPLLLTLHVLFPHCLLDALDLLDRGFVVKLGSASSRQQHLRFGVGDGGDGGRQSDVGAENDRERTSWYVLSSRNTSSNVSAKTGLGRSAGGGDWDTQRWTSRGGRGRHLQAYDAAHAYASTRYGTAAYDDGSNNNRNRDDSDITEDAGGDGQGVAKRGGSGSIEGLGTSYHVHLTAWNCSCPAFAFAAFAGITTTSGAHDNATSVSAADEADRDGGGGGDGGEGKEGDHATVESKAEAQRPLDERINTMWVTQPQQATIAPSPPPPPPPPSTSNSNMSTSTSTPPPFPFGGLAQSSPSKQGNAQIPPTCKHLLACLLAETCPAFFVPGHGGITSHDQVGHGRNGESGQGHGQGRKGVMVRGDCAGEEIAAWASGGVFV